ncbi:guanine nucleotide exchange factor [Anaeramoeba flamelloides]|uniref:Guanine nucleotide exchange factor n=1 Tax=Anaeramoeba flamelloides TaxID=1746091 RepID=A0ABQ8YF53_9EUKA|nr:guanine nucleotide exchange factor [Anaeramoeba flamelloides]
MSGLSDLLDEQLARLTKRTNFGNNPKKENKPTKQRSYLDVLEEFKSPKTNNTSTLTKSQNSFNIDSFISQTLNRSKNTNTNTNTKINPNTNTNTNTKFDIDEILKRTLNKNTTTTPNPNTNTNTNPNFEIDEIIKSNKNKIINLSPNTNPNTNTTNEKKINNNVNNNVNSVKKIKKSLSKLKISLKTKEQTKAPISIFTISKQKQRYNTRKRFENKQACHQNQSNYSNITINDLFKKPTKTLRDNLNEHHYFQNNGTEISLQYQKKGIPSLSKGSKESIVYHFLTNESLDLEMFSVFLLIYENFMSKYELFGYLIKYFDFELEKSNHNYLFKKIKKPIIQDRILKLLQIWTRHQVIDFSGDSTWIQDTVHPFLESRIGAINLGVSRKLKICIERQVKSRTLRDLYVSYGNLFEKNKHSRNNSYQGKIKFQNLSSQVIAAQMTLHALQQFSELDLKEFNKDRNWDDEQNLKSNLPKLFNYLNYLQRTTGWICTTILSESKVSNRVSRITKWLDVSQILMKLNNYQHLFCIMSALQSLPVTRLDTTWASVPNNSKRVLDKLRTITNKKNNFRKYRSLLKNSKLPVIPLIDLMLYDISLIDYQEKSYFGNSQAVLNINKFLKIGKIIKNIKNFQQSVYFDISPIKQLQKFLIGVQPWSNEKLLKRSKKNEKNTLMKFIHLLFEKNENVNNQQTMSNQNMIYGNNKTNKKNHNFDENAITQSNCLNGDLRKRIVDHKQIMIDEISEEEDFLKKFSEIDERFAIIERNEITETQNKNITNTNINVIGGTLEWLVEYLCSERGSNPLYLNTFLLTYQTFTTGSELLLLLKERFLMKPPHNLEGKPLRLFKDKIINTVKFKVFNVLNQWMRTHSTDFGPNTGLDEELLAFIEQDILNDPFMNKSGLVLKGVLNKLKNNNYVFASNARKYGKMGSFNKSTNNLNKNFPKPIIPRLLSNDQELTFTDINEKEFMRQLTLMEFDLYQKIKPREFLNQAWTRKNKEELAPNITKFTQSFNLFSNWMANEILSHDKLKNRVNCLGKFIKIGYHLKKIGNFNSVQEIIAGLSSSGVFRLKQTWNALPNKLQNIWVDLNELMRGATNYKIIRQILSTIDPPALPYIGMFLTDLVFIDDGNANNLKSVASKNNFNTNFINFEKRQKTARIISTIQQFQHIPFNFQRIEVIQNFISRNINVTYDTKKLYQRSLIVEPRMKK